MDQIRNEAEIAMRLPFVAAKPVTTVSAVITRADGTVVDLGVVSRNGKPVGRIRRSMDNFVRRIKNGSF